MKRRNFIYTAGTGASLPLLMGKMNVKTLTNSPLFSFINNESDRVLVIVQMIGGNDGLNTFIPLDKFDNLMNIRGNIMLPRQSLLNLTDTTAMHPSMIGLRSLYDDGKLGVIQSVGYPNQNRSHFRSTDIWSTGSPANEFWTTGWMGRFLDSQHPEFPTDYPNEDHPDPIAITIGNSVTETCQGMVANYSLTFKDPFSLSPISEGNNGETPETPYGEELTFLRQTIAQTNAYSEVIVDAAEAGTNQVNYPDSKLGDSLKNVALLISGGLKTKVYVVNIGGFDTHANQVLENDTKTGKHSELLTELSDAILAFQEDLKQQGLEEKVIGMTFSEFGRRIKSNDSFGTDHGTAAPLMVFGSCVNPQILGNSPDIGTEVANNEGVAMEHDFRDIYGSILMDWFEVPETAVQDLIYNEFQYLPVLSNCNVSTNTESVVQPAIEMDSFPNPFQNWTTIRFTSNGEWVKLSIYDTLGSEIKVLVDGKLPAGPHQIKFEAHDLAPGHYFYRMQMGSQVRTQKLSKS